MLRYDELIRFEAVESVVQLKEANNIDYAVSLLNTYVISDHMAEKLVNEIIENIQFDRWVDNKGMLIVGNYGTGKSHLMSVISTIAELPGASEHIRHKKVAEKAKEIEGKFQVIRAEFGAVTMSLRDIICRELERGLEKMGIDYVFPAADQVTNNKEMFYEMMELFHEQYPDKGMLLVIDELLDYLRGRKEQELTLDLGFLREIGEVCGKSRFRFISGVQEMLFDNPKFSFVADSLRRVKERFTEARIVREDIAFVVSERLLKKNDEQKAFIREHLSKFTKLYNGLAEEMETFVNMYPIHPSYLETFEKVNIAEKRVVLQTISKEIKKLLTTEIPEEATGLISFDHYWQYIEEDSALRTNDNVKLVMNKVEMLKGCIQTGVKGSYKNMANQLVNALAVYRLTTDDLKTPIGLTSESLRDKLFISNSMLLELDEEAAEFLMTLIEAVMKDLMNAASFQFVSLNKDNGQYYIDIAKVTAVDELIQQRGEGLTDNQLDSYYYQVLKQATEVADTSYVSGYKIWLHEIPWIDRRVKRQGYIFFGAPNERSTAQPERDFYIYMLQPFEEPKFKDEQKEDEVFFRLVKKNADFVNLLRLYSGSCEMYNDTTTNRHLYKPKMDDYLKKLVKWLKENFVEAFEIVYRGKHADVLEHGFFLPSNADTLIQIIDSVAQDLLSQWFEVKYSEYPTFRNLDKSYVTKSNMHTYVKDALDYLNGKKTSQGEAILSGLVLLDSNGNLTVRNSGYAKWILEILNEKENGKVVNQNELIEVINTAQGTTDQRLTKQFLMEPELLVVVIAALIQSGEIVVTINGKIYEAMNFGELVRLPINELTYFNHIKKPSGLPIPAVQQLIDMFGAVQADFTDPNSVDFAIKQIISRAKEETSKTVEMIVTVREKFQIWDGQLFSPGEKAEKLEKLSSLSEFLQDIQVYNTRAKMVNLKYDVNRIEKEKENLLVVYQLEKLQQKISEYTKVADYLTKARYIASPSQEWIEDVSVSLDNLSIALKNGDSCSREVAELERLKKEYIEYYMRLHQTARLNATENKRKSKILKDPRYDALDTLAVRIPFLPSQVFKEWKLNIESLKDCYHLTAESLQHTPECMNCRFNPRQEQSQYKPSLSQLEDQLEEMLQSWTETLLVNFNDPSVKESIELLESEQKHLMDELIQKQAFTLPIKFNLINAINVVLEGIHKEKIEIGQLIKIFGEGNPVTVDEVRKNFDSLIKELVGTNEINRVRLTLKK
ncbi:MULTISPECIES: DUF6079 family protein [Bacillus cereus group]|uniref:ATP-binding protein n=3 Tax=Bacillus TaxID=1386 RepID=A0A9X8SKG9_9BACI|nr:MULTISPECIES: DUF6079 family protein [Bacillus cereus group]MCH5438466.1 DUF6079 family protein [Bacillus paranthracis]MDA1986267.1 DUF6079 family protein [Bacillus cereus group sp. BcHK104]SME36463.1 hypothetical protein BACERE00221_04219 [Bacillus paranthracis]